MNHCYTINFCTDSDIDEYPEDDTDVEMSELEEPILNLSLDLEVHSLSPKKVKSSLDRGIKYLKNEADNADHDSQILIEAIPAILDEMKSIGHREASISFNKMLANKQFPLDNIAFLLFMDVCMFLSMENSSSMRYSNKVKQFWRIGFKLFHGKWLRFMGGPKHLGHIIINEGEKGVYPPSESN